MASSVVVFAFLVLCYVACAKSATVDLNAVCDSQNNLCNTGAKHVCDTNIVPSVCKIQADDMTGCSNTEECVTGSTCKAESGGTKMCKCTADISTIDGDKRCAPKAGYLGGACDSKGQCTAGKGICGAGNKCICGTQTGVTTNYATYTCTPPAGYIGGACDDDSCTAGKGVCDKTTTKCLCGHSDFVTVNYATYTCIPVKSDSPPPVVPPVDKSGSGMLIMSTFLVTIVSSLSKMMM